MLSPDSRYFLRALIAGSATSTDMISAVVSPRYPGDRPARIAALQATLDALVADGLAALDTETYSVTPAGEQAIADFDAANNVVPP